MRVERMLTIADPARVLDLLELVEDEEDQPAKSKRRPGRRRG